MNVSMLTLKMLFKHDIHVYNNVQVQEVSFSSANKCMQFFKFSIPVTFEGTQVYGDYYVILINILCQITVFFSI